MKNLLNKNVLGIEMSGIRKIANKIERSTDIINLTWGQPNFSTPEYVKKAGITAIEENQNAYSETAGLFELRQAACDYVRDLYHLSYHPEDEVIVTTGASEALDLAFRTILEEGSEVILPVPIYPGYEPLIKLCNAVPVLIDTTESNFKLTAAQLEAHITERTRCVVLPYPSNPLGSILTQEEVLEISKVLEDKKIFIISDEIYSELIYDEEHFSIGRISNLKDRTIIINGLSKSHSMTGWRIGFAFAPSYLIDQFYKIHSFNSICPSIISQYASIPALTQGTYTEEILAMKNEYKLRKELAYRRIVEMDLEVVEPKGAFYIFPSIKKTGLTSLDFSMKLLDQEKVAVIPGSSFSDFGEGYIRISYAQSREDLIKGLDGIERFLQTIKMAN
ncbi:aminotransferase class I/II-fold pyridoxal phosphate-dependent enzyme [Neobacillus sp. 114]|uniref:aminotransferase class I/II-fold pyridoxal phosphate-dependent enzyme n=1 Tax=Neobacillus sp. 114 TaxID=3048535 RepID=UPI0024C3AAA1|nr:aminotransferase class I/II-fold pyridoxal phosphate-dependent enzyme [Neobacillus sp. 114]